MHGESEHDGTNPDQTRGVGTRVAASPAYLTPPPWAFAVQFAAPQSTLTMTWTTRVKPAYLADRGARP